jgi:DNA-binding MarR family transcriptional regulator
MPTDRNAPDAISDDSSGRSATSHTPSPLTLGWRVSGATEAERVAVAWRALRRGSAARRMRALAWAPDPPLLNMGQIDSLDLLVTRRGWTMCDFAAALGVNPSTATRAVDRFVAIGLAEREHGHIDKRFTLVHATQAGRDAQRRFVRRRLAVVADALETFTHAERQTLVDLLDRLVAALDVTVEAHAEATSMVRAAQGATVPAKTSEQAHDE